MKPSRSLVLAAVVAGSFFALVPGSGLHALGQNPNSNGQGTGNNNGIGDGQGGGRPEWAASLRHDTSRPLRDITPLPGVSTREDFEVKRGGPDDPGAPDTEVQSLVVAPLAAIGGVGFDGVGEGNSKFSYNVNHAPPDTVGEAGLTQFVQWVNPSFAIFDKATGNLLYGPAAGNTIWQGFGGNCETHNDGDPMVQYDQLADRWVMTQFSLQKQGSLYFQCIAISKTSDATGQWHRYAFQFDHFPDYPKLAVWPDAYYITFNMFGTAGTSFTGSRVCAYDRAKMLEGLPATQICGLPSTAYHSFLASDLEGKTLPPAGSPNYVMNRFGSGINVWKFKPNFATPSSSTFTGPTTVPGVAAYTTACASCVPQPQTTQTLDTLGDRLMYRLVYRNLGNRESLLVNHSVSANGEIGVRWYEFNVSNTSVTVRQQSTYAPDDNQYRWMGSIAIDKIGNIALGFSIGSATQKPSIRFAGRETTDPLNTLSMDTNMHTGTGSQTTNLSRWGDYSSMTVDPVDDCTFWYTSEYLQTNGTFNWSTRVGSFKFSSCAPAPSLAVDVQPATQTISAGGATTFTATLDAQNGYSGTGTYSVTGLPANVTPSFAPTGFTGGGSTTLTLSSTAAVAPGTYQLTITAADNSGSPSDSENVTLVINPAPTFTFGAAPSSLSVTQGQFATYNLTVTGQNGYAGNGTYSTSSLPAGVQAFLSPDTYSNGNGASQLTLVTDATTPPGTYQVTVTATDTNKTPVQSANITLVVNAAAASGFTLSASPSTQPIAPNGSAAFSAIVTAQGGYTGTGTFGVTGLPAGTSGSFSNPTYSGGGGNSILTITAGPTVTPGSYTLAISATGSGGASTQSTSVVLVVDPPQAPPTFTLSASPSSRTVTQGEATTFGATVTPQNGYAGSGSFSVLNLPQGAAFDPAGFSSGNYSATLTVTTSATTPAGSYSLTIRATDGSIVRDTNVTLVVNAAAQADFTLSVTPGSRVIKRGKSDTYNVTVTPVNGFNGTVSLSVSGVPADTNASFSPVFINGGGSSTLTITTLNPASPKGTFTLTIIATSGSLTRSTTVQLKIQ